MTITNYGRVENAFLINVKGGFMPMKNKLMRKAAEIKSALVSKEAAMNSTEVVVLILFVVIIVFAVGALVKTQLTGDDGKSGIAGDVMGKVSTKASGIDAA